MGEQVVQHGLEGVIAFETQIAEPDREGGALRYRGVDIEELVGHYDYGRVWGLLVDGSFEPGLPPAEPFPIPVHSGDIRVDVQSALAMLAPFWGLEQMLDIDDTQVRDDLARASVMALSFVAQSARGLGLAMVPQKHIDGAATITERFMRRWRGDPDPNHVKAVDAYWVSAAEHGMNASTFTARVIASTGADVAAALSGAVGALSGPLHGGAPSRVADARRGRAGRRRRPLGQAGDGSRRPPDGLRPPRVPRRRSPRPSAAPHREGAEVAARRGRRGPRACCARRTESPLPRSCPGHQRRVLVGRRARLRRGSRAHVHGDVRLRPHRRVECPHPRAEAHRPVDQAIGDLHRPGLAAAQRRQR